EELLDRVRKLRLPQPVRRPCLGWHEPARELVLALGSAFERADASLDAEFQRLVVAGFEVQQRNVGDRAPVTAVERFARENVERAGDRLSVEFDEYHQHVPGQRFAEAPEKIQLEIGRRVVRAVGAVVAAREETPVLLAYLVSDQ